MSEIWEKARPHLLPAIDHLQGSLTEADIIERLDSQYQVWLYPNSAILTEIVQFPQFAALNIALAGGDKDELNAAVPEIEAYARRAGCKRSMIAGRQGWRRERPDYRFGYTMLYKDL